MSHSRPENFRGFPCAVLKNVARRAWHPGLPVAAWHAVPLWRLWRYARKVRANLSGTGAMIFSRSVCRLPAVSSSRPLRLILFVAATMVGFLQSDSAIFTRRPLLPQPSSFSWRSSALALSASAWDFVLQCLKLVVSRPALSDICARVFPLLPVELELLAFRDDLAWASFARRPPRGRCRVWLGSRMRFGNASSSARTAAI